MRIIKSERLKKLEVELNDLTQWLKLGLVPKKDVKKHEEEIKAVQAKIQEELDRLQFLRESGEMDDAQAPKRSATRTGFTDMPTIPDIDVPDTAVGGYTETGIDNENESSIGPTSSSSRDKEDTQSDADEATTDEDESTEEDQDEESYFSERNRWKRGGIVDPDADEW